MIELGKFKDLDIFIDKKDGIIISYRSVEHRWIFRPCGSSNSDGSFNVDYLKQLSSIKNISTDRLVPYLCISLYHLHYTFSSLELLHYHTYNSSEFCNFILGNSEVNAVFLLNDILE